MEQATGLPPRRGGTRARWLTTAAGMLLILAVLAGCAPAARVETADAVAGGDSVEDPGGVPTKGIAGAPVTLVVFCDFV